MQYLKALIMVELTPYQALTYLATLSAYLKACSEVKSSPSQRKQRVAEMLRSTRGVPLGTRGGSQVHSAWITETHPQGVPLGTQEETADIHAVPKGTDNGGADTIPGTHVPGYLISIPKGMQRGGIVELAHKITAGKAYRGCSTEQPQKERQQKIFSLLLSSKRNAMQRDSSLRLSPVSFR